MTHICVGNLAIIGTYNGLSPARHQAIICWDIVNSTLRNKLQWILIGIQTFSFMKMHLEMSSAKRPPFCLGPNVLTHGGRVTHIYVRKLTSIGSDNGLSPDRRQAIIWTNAGLSFFLPLATNFSEILIEILTFSFKKMRLKMPSAKCCSFRLGLNVLRDYDQSGGIFCQHEGAWKREFQFRLDALLAPRARGIVTS